jgi:hypothetical protein
MFSPNETKKEYLNNGIFLLQLVIEDRKKSLKKARKANIGIEKLDKCGNETCTNKGIKMCKSCLYFTYCSRECQKAHWKKHKLLCKEINYCMVELKRKQSLYAYGLLDGDEPLYPVNG